MGKHRDLGTILVKPIALRIESDEKLAHLEFRGSVIQVAPYTIAVVDMPIIKHNCRGISIGYAKCRDNEEFVAKRGEDIAVGRAKKKIERGEVTFVSESDTDYLELAISKHKQKKETPAI